MCFSLAWIAQLLVWLVIVAAIVAIIRLVVPFLDSLTGMPIIGQVLLIVLWAVVAIMAIYLVIGLISCVVGGAGGVAFPFPHK